MSQQRFHLRFELPRDELMRIGAVKRSEKKVAKSDTPRVEGSVLSPRSRKRCFTNGTRVGQCDRVELRHPNSLVVLSHQGAITAWPRIYLFFRQKMLVSIELPVCLSSMPFLCKSTVSW